MGSSLHYWREYPTHDSIKTGAQLTLNFQEPRLTAVLNHPPTVPDLTSDDITKLDAAQKASLPSPAPLAGGPFVLSSGIKAW